MKVVLICLALVLSLAAALPLEGSTDGAREERAKKESAKLRLMDAVSNSRPSTTVTKERQSTNATPNKEKEEQVDVSMSHSESTVVSKVSKPEGTVSKVERQRSIADQALRERLRQSSRTKEQTATPAAPTSSPEKIEEAQEEEETEYPPVVYVPLPASQPLRFAPYFPVMRPPSSMSKLSTRQLQFWPFAHLFPLVINDPVVTLSGGFSNWIEYGPSADVCNPKGKGRLGEEETEVSMESGGVVSKLIVRGGGVAIAGPGGVATAGRGGTAIVGPGGVAYTSPGAMAIVGPGGKVIRRRGDAGEGKIEGRSFDMAKGGVVVARGPVIYYDSSEDQK